MNDGCGGECARCARSWQTSLCRSYELRLGMTAALMSLHVAANAKRFAAARVSALERLLARVAMTVDFEAAWARKGLFAGSADVSLLDAGEAGLTRGANVVVVLPWVGCRYGAWCHHWWSGYHLWREVGGKRSLLVHCV